MRSSILVLILVVLTGCNALNKKLCIENDNVAEEFIEKLIEENIGVVVDLSA